MVHVGTCFLFLFPDLYLLCVVCDFIQVTFFVYDMMVFGSVWPGPMTLNIVPKNSVLISLISDMLGNPPNSYIKLIFGARPWDFEPKLASPWPRVVSVIALPSRTAHPYLLFAV